MSLVMSTCDVLLTISGANCSKICAVVRNVTVSALLVSPVVSGILFGWKKNRIFRLGSEKNLNFLHNESASKKVVSPNVGRGNVMHFKWLVL